MMCITYKSEIIGGRSGAIDHLVLELLTISSATL